MKAEWHLCAAVTPVCPILQLEIEKDQKRSSVYMFPVLRASQHFLRFPCAIIFWIIISLSFYHFNLSCSIFFPCASLLCPICCCQSILPSDVSCNYHPIFLIFFVHLLVCLLVIYVAVHFLFYTIWLLCDSCSMLHLTKNIFFSDLWSEHFHSFSQNPLISLDWQLLKMAPSLWLNSQQTEKS